MSVLPDQCAIAFKEWSEICGVLADGLQTLIVRKGGIREGPSGFSPEHQAFWLYPTFMHQAQQGLRDREPDPAGKQHAADPGDRLSIRALAVVEQLWHVRSEADLPPLTPFHHWAIETLRVRFRYRQPGLWVLGVRVYRQEQPWSLTPTTEQLGCKSWVLLDPPVSTALLRPVLDDEAWSQQIGRLRAVLGPDTLIDQRSSPA